MIIYKITNTVTRMSYIGQTVNSFNYRYSGGNWDKHTRNKKLKNSVKKHGKEKFLVEILEEGDFSKAQLDKKESFYISKYNTIHPNGYNFKQVFSRNIKRKITKLLSPEGEVVSFDNINDFCCKFKLNRTSVWRLKSGKIKQHKGWVALDSNTKISTLISPNGKSYRVVSGQIKSFCRKNNLNSSCISSVLKGTRKQHKGWTLKNNKNSIKDRIIFSPDKSLHKIPYRGLIKFCKKYELSAGAVSELLSNKRKKHKGWTAYF